MVLQDPSLHLLQQVMDWVNAGGGHLKALDVGLCGTRVGQPRPPPGLSQSGKGQRQLSGDHAIGVSFPLNMVRSGTISQIAAKGDQFYQDH